MSMRSLVEDSRACVLWCLMSAALVLAFGCAEKDFPASSPSSAAPAPPATQAAPAPVTPAAELQAMAYRETGIASWYGREFHGRKTASGETFDMHALSAAHRTLPFGTVIRVTNLDNFKSIKVRVNDRGPFSGNRILELSYGAARELGFAAQGTAPVRIETMEKPNGNAVYTVQAAVFTEEENAQLLKDRLSRKFEVVAIVPFETNLGKFYRVRVGSYGTEEKAELVAGKLKLEGLEPYVMKKD
jgi:rare lipoprotein A